MVGLIRVASESDARGIAEVVVNTWQVIYKGILCDDNLANLSIIEREECWRRRLQGKDPKALDWVNLVYEKDQKIIGFATYRPCGDEDKDRASVGELVAIYMLPEHWGQGLGKKLMDEVLVRLNAQEISEVSLWVIEANAKARRFYEYTGFKADGKKIRKEVLKTEIVEIRYVKNLR